MKKETNATADEQGKEHQRKATLAAVPIWGAARGAQASGSAQAPVNEDAMCESAFGPGRELGPYRIVRQVGRGGMSLVYLAERTDVADKKAALKILRITEPDIKRRFDQEQMILARLDHPNIARFYDLGTTPEGSPWLALEYVDGVWITQWCDRRKLNVRERIELFLLVCDAVSHAHQNLIIHRDLKPGNVMVNDIGEPKLLDFGIAAILNPDTGTQQTLTHAAGPVMTPAYASPEQWLGEPLNAATDVYSLGVLLFELLTGTLPYEVTSRSPLTAYHMVVESDVPSLASRFTGTSGQVRMHADNRNVDPIKMRRLLKGDLNLIVGKALRKNKGERYPSVENFAQDLRSWLSGDTIRARPITWRYRFAKYVHRNRFPLGFGLSTILILAMSLWVVWHEKQRTETQRVLAEQERATSEEITDYMVSLFKYADPANNMGETISARDMLELGRDRLTGELEGRDYVRGRLLMTMGVVYQGLSDFEESERMLRESADLMRKAGRHGYLVEVLTNAVHTYSYLNQIDKMEACVAEAMDIVRNHPVGEDRRADALMSMGFSLYVQGEYEEAEPWLLQSLQVMEQHYGPDQPEVATVHFYLGSNNHYLRNLKEAEYHYKKAVALAEGADGMHRAYLLIYKDAYGGVLRDQGRYEEAVALIEEVIEAKKKIYGEDHPYTLQSIGNAGLIAESAFDMAKAERLQREVLTKMGARFGKEHYLYALALSDLARVITSRGAYEDAEELFREAMAVNTSIYGPEHHLVTSDRLRLARVLLSQHKVSVAERLLNQALEYFHREEGEDSVNLGSVYFSIADVHKVNGDFDQALRYSEKGRDLFAAHFGASTDYGLSARENVARHLVIAGRLAEAEPLFDEILAEGEVERPRLRSLKLADDVAKLRYLRGEAAEGLRLHDAVLAEARRFATERDDLGVASVYETRAAILARLGRFAEAADLARESADMVARITEEDHLLMVEPLVQAALMEGLAGRMGRASKDMAGAERALAEVDATESALPLTLRAAKARLAFYRGDLDQAEAGMKRVIEERRNLYGEAFPYLAEDYLSLARVLLATREAAEAQRWLEAADPFYRAMERESGMLTAELKVYRADAAAWQDRWDEAGSLLDEARAVLEKHRSPNHPALIRAQLVSGRLLAAEGRLDEALSRAETAIQRLKELHGADSIWVGDARARLADMKQLAEVPRPR
ncbi:Non-specific serine/threonine protein kinase [Sulfidibacter corallicola]|uniref:Tetratricopeptide repeat protein n=1 Tax=Sulfidibacter corallicola TaxID=2818388 RepID=A0A8A4TJ79_SULCO|nr:serine/threonine-protein kinase [Sulfidibacter corallicola]QTD49976.1 tetratricopeptide repeat protein [Sulfidibacter corallicola]